MLVLLLLFAHSSSAPELMAQEIGRLCAPCHTEHVEDVRAHKHGAAKISCELCHGASQKHRDAIGAAAPDRIAGPDEVPALCGSCHTAQGKEYAASKHGKLVAARSEKRAANCGTCHGVHAARNAAAMKRQCERCHAVLPPACTRPIESPAGKLVCARCHNPHTLARLH